jgi:hypothetical protein
MLATILFFVSPVFAATTTADQIQELEDRINSAQSAAENFEVDGDEMPEILEPEADRKPAVMDMELKNGLNESSDNY